jgi:hypothetical protein
MDILCFKQYKSKPHLPPRGQRVQMMRAAGRPPLPTQQRNPYEVATGSGAYSNQPRLPPQDPRSLYAVNPSQNVSSSVPVHGAIQLGSGQGFSQGQPPTRPPRPSGTGGAPSRGMLPTGNSLSARSATPGGPPTLAETMRNASPQADFAGAAGAPSNPSPQQPLRGISQPGSRTGSMSLGNEGVSRSEGVPPPFPTPVAVEAPLAPPTERIVVATPAPMRQ